MAADFVFVRRARTPRTMVLLALVHAALIAAVVLLDAALWLIGGLALLTVPALWDLVTDPEAGVRLSDTQLRWHSGRRRGDLALADIDHMRFDTRWDFSIRVSAVLRQGKRVHLPFESTPPHRSFEDQFQARGIPVKRTHFGFF